MRIDRTQNAIRGIAAGLCMKLYQMVVPFLMRTVMIYTMGVEYLGLNSLFTSILHILNLAELGVGAAMVFSMYKPIAEDDTACICALLKLYRRYYRMIGVIIGVVGLMLTPFIPKLIAGTIPEGINVYWLYLLNLGSTVLSYWLFAYRSSLLQAHQRRDVISLVMLAANVVQHILQMLILLYLRNYYLYVIVMLLCTALNNVLSGVVTIRMYPQYRPQGQLDRETQASIMGRIRDIFTGKLGSVVLQYADTIVLSAFMGLTMLAIYQNYFFILSSVLAIVEIIISSITAGLGNSFVMESKGKNYADMRTFTFMFLWLTGMCTCCFLGMYQPFMELWMGEALMLPYGMVISFALYFFVFALNRLLSVYKDAAGLWHMDRFNPLVCAIVNLALYLLLIRPLGLYGVVLSTVIALAAIGIPWVLRNLFTGFFERGQLMPYVKVILKFVLLTAFAGGIVSAVGTVCPAEPWLALLCNMLVSVLVPNVLFLIVFYRDEQFRQALRFADRLTKNKLRLEKRLLPKE